MARIWEGKYAGNFIVSESTTGGTGVSRSREQFTVPANSPALKVGQVITVTAGVVTIYADGDTPAGVVFDNVAVDTVNAQEQVMLVRDCEVNGAELEWDVSLTNAQLVIATTALTALGIIVR
jgi:hypothetical protein